jgi:hypothetical protein
MWLLRLIHIGAGVFWAGGAMIMGWFVAPSARRAGPASGPFMQALLKARLADIMFGSAVVTVLAGIWLLFATGGPRSGWQGWALNLGALSALTAITVGGIVQRPTAAKIQKLGEAIAGGSPTPDQVAEMGSLQGRMGRVASTTALLVAVAVAGMAIGG